MLKITLLAISRPLLHIFAPNLIQRLKTGSHSQIYRNSAIFESLCTKFDTETKNEGSDQILPAKLISHKIQDGGGCHNEIQIFSHNCAIIPYICIDFNTLAKNHVPQPDLASKFTYCKNPRWRPSLF